MAEAPNKKKQQKICKKQGLTIGSIVSEYVSISNVSVCVCVFHVYIFKDYLVIPLFLMFECTVTRV